MILPAKIEYAYKAILELSLHYRANQPVQLSVISQAQGIPKKFLIQLLSRLKNAGIVESARGIAGGYYLTRHPARISLADIFRAIDENIIEAPKKIKAAKLSTAERLILRILDETNKETVKKLESISFEHLALQLKNEQLTYYI